MATSDLPLSPAEQARWQSPAVIASLLRTAETIAVYGCSADPAKASHEVAAYLRTAGYRVLPVNPRGGTILGEPVFTSLAAIGRPVDVVDCFRPSSELSRIVEEAVAAGARAVWFQLGLFDRLAAERAERAGLVVVVDRCTLIEHRRLAQR